MVRGLLPVLAVAVCLGLSACGSDDDNTVSSAAEQPVDESSGTTDLDGVLQEGADSGDEACDTLTSIVGQALTSGAGAAEYEAEVTLAYAEPGWIECDMNISVIRIGEYELGVTIVRDGAIDLDAMFGGFDPVECEYSPPVPEASFTCYDQDRVTRQDLERDGDPYPWGLTMTVANYQVMVSLTNLTPYPSKEAIDLLANGIQTDALSLVE